LSGIDGSKREKSLRHQARLSEGRKTQWLVLEAHWKENGRDVTRRFSENAFGDGIAEHKAREGARSASRISGEAASINHVQRLGDRELALDLGRAIGAGN